ncbi:hypothetical protein C2S51_006886 [Perilla frutescens var. frutescens]|nr:hypothetical protein C2S51_006886 [Perilla frutescens var. frutescens]
MVHRSVSAQDIHHHTKPNPPISITNLRVDSFSSYLNAAADHSNFIFQLPAPIQDPTSAFTFSHQIPKDAEIGVFGADKYFNMKLEYQTNPIKNHQREPAAPNINAMPRPPSFTSQASSWNSQTTLLPDFQRNHGSQMKQKKAIARRLFMGFGCRSGPCFDKKSVKIDEIVAQEAPYHNNSKPTRIDHRLPLPPPPPPPINQDSSSSAKKQQLPINVDLDESRPSIEVFGSHNRSSKGDAVATNMERKLSMLTWDAIPKGKNPPTSTLGTSTICDDMASDASSDLFEIENISGSIYPLLASELAAADDMSSCCMSPTSLYAPSEASIQWSVITASAADYSALSEFNDESVSVVGDAAVSKKIVAKRGKDQVQNSKSRPPAGIFLGCKSGKAVDVAENVCVKSNEKAKINQLQLP